MNLISVDRPDSYTYAAYENDKALGSQITGLLNASSITDHFPKGVRLGLPKAAGYLNMEGGWADASEGIRRAMDIVRAGNGEILEGRQVSHLNFGSTGQAGGVTLVSGEVIDADVTVIATGSWTGSLLSDVALGLDDRILATGCHLLLFRVQF
jgi:sarcosine oxidase / L-pipecolate oxidase